MSNKFTDAIISINQKKNKYERNAITEKEEALILDEEKTKLDFMKFAFCSMFLFNVAYLSSTIYTWLYLHNI